MINKIVLAYSGGLDTSVAIKWLQEKYDAEIITYTADLGQQGLNKKELKEKALATGASQVIIEDLKSEFINEYVFPALQVGAVYEGKYPMATALARPLIAKKMVAAAEAVGADAVAHGCTGKGNDQVRFETAFAALNPELEVIAPLRDWGFTTRDTEIEYAKKHDIPVKATSSSPYSIDENIWGISVECGQLEDPWLEPPSDAYQWTNDIENTPDKAIYLTLGFKSGVPVTLNGQTLKPIELVEKLNKIGANYGVGRIDMVENRLVGIKSREIYEAPAASILMQAHQDLSALVLQRETMHFKETLMPKYSETVYYGLWFSELRQAMQSFFNSFKDKINGEVKIKLYKGQAKVVGRKSNNSLYDNGLATYDKSDSFDHDAAAGFIKLWSLPLKTAGKAKNSTEEDNNIENENNINKRQII